jgi:hypothetical protein
LDEIIVCFPSRVFFINFTVVVFLVEKFHPGLEASTGFDLWKNKGIKGGKFGFIQKYKIVSVT